jgi:TPR repeat protein
VVYTSYVRFMPPLYRLKLSRKKSQIRIILDSLFSDMMFLFLFGAQFVEANGEEDYSAAERLWIPNRPLACRLYEQSADAGYPPAQLTYAQRLSHGECGPANYTRAASYYRSAASSANPSSDALIAYAEVLWFGIGTDRDRSDAIDLFFQAAEIGNATTRIRIAHHFLSFGERVSTARHFFKMAAASGSVDARYRVSKLYPRGSRKARVYLKAAAKADHLKALWSFSRQLAAQGKVRRSIAHLEKAAVAGHVRAQIAYAERLLMGEWVSQNDREAAFHMRLAAEAGNGIAQFRYGELLWYGTGVKKDRFLAEQYYRRAASQEIALARIRVNFAGDSDWVNESTHGTVRMYADRLWFGRGVEQDRARAVDLIRWSALRGDTRAQFLYGEILWFGLHVDKDRHEALEYFKAAALKGHPIALYRMLCPLFDDALPRVTIPVECNIADVFEFSGSLMDYADLIASGNAFVKNQKEAEKLRLFARQTGRDGRRTRFEFESNYLHRRYGHCSTVLVHQAYDGHRDALVDFADVLVQRSRHAVAANFYDEAASRGSAHAAFHLGEIMWSLNREWACEHYRTALRYHGASSAGWIEEAGEVCPDLATGH